MAVIPVIVSDEGANSSTSKSGNTLNYKDALLIVANNIG